MSWPPFGTLRLYENVVDIPILIHRTPEIMALTLNGKKHLIPMPLVAMSGASMPQLVRIHSLVRHPSEYYQCATYQEFTNQISIWIAAAPPDGKSAAARTGFSQKGTNAPRRRLRISSSNFSA